MFNNTRKSKKQTLIVFAVIAAMLAAGILFELFDACSQCNGSGECEYCAGTGACNICFGRGVFQGAQCIGCYGGECSICDGDGRCFACD